MISRRRFGYATLCGLCPEIAFAQHAAVQGDVPPGTVWLNANENPDGPPQAAKDAIVAALAEAGRYSHRALPSVYAALARSVGLEPDQVLAGTGSTEILHCAIYAFTSATRPLITAWPTWELAAQLAEASGRRAIKVPLMKNWSVDVERMAGEARKAGGGLIHLGNPNNPTSSLTPRSALQWLAANIPPNTVVLIDEAYIQFADPQHIISGVELVKEGRNVVATRTFSKLYGMAGVRMGFGCAPSALVKQMLPFRINVISIVGGRAGAAALESGDAFVAERRVRRNRIRADVCAWLDRNGFQFIPPHANFVLIDIRRDVRDVIPRMLAEGVAVGRRFDSLDGWMRVTIGTEREMTKFKDAFKKVVVG